MAVWTGLTCIFYQAQVCRPFSVCSGAQVRSGRLTLQLVHSGARQQEDVGSLAGPSDELLKECLWLLTRFLIFCLLDSWLAVQRYVPLPRRWTEGLIRVSHFCHLHRMKRGQMTFTVFHFHFRWIFFTWQQCCYNLCLVKVNDWSEEHIIHHVTSGPHFPSRPALYRRPIRSPETRDSCHWTFLFLHLPPCISTADWKHGHLTLKDHVSPDHQQLLSVCQTLSHVFWHWSSYKPMFVL